MCCDGLNGVMSFGIEDAAAVARRRAREYDNALEQRKVRREMAEAEQCNREQIDCVYCGLCVLIVY